MNNIVKQGFYIMVKCSDCNTTMETDSREWRDIQKVMKGQMHQHQRHSLRVQISRVGLVEKIVENKC